MAKVSHRQAEREFYYRKLGGSFPQKPIHQLARDYFLSYLGANAPTNTIPLEQLESMWAKQYIITNGGTPPTGHYMSALWRQLVVIIGKTPNKSENDNAYTFYVNAP